MKKRILFIINPVAGVRRKDRIPRAINAWLDHDRYDYEVIYTEGRGHATEIAQQAVKDKYDIVCVAGGDGSVNEVATGLIGSETCLAIIPAGSGNGLARHLGYSILMRSTIEIINAHAVREIDVCRVNNYYFFSLIGIGFDAYVAKVFSREETRGFLTYLWCSLKSVRSFEPFAYTMQYHGVEEKGKAFMINICNSNQYGYNVKVAPQASLQDGMLDVVMVDALPKWKIPFLVLRVFLQIHMKSKYVRLMKCSAMYVEASRHAYLQVDGETVHKDKDFHISILPKALRVLVNASRFDTDVEQK
ncbi:MAG: diacylglycerol kinase family lipid kinase [Chitinophagales bacterium]